MDQQVLRADFPPPPAGVLEVTTRKGSAAIPLDQVRQVVLKGCGQCPDLTSELADLSVGAAEGRSGWNTILVRSPRGRELLELASQRGLLEMEPMLQECLEHLRAAAANKRARAQAAW